MALQLKYDPASHLVALVASHSGRIGDGGVEESKGTNRLLVDTSDTFGGEKRLMVPFRLRYWYFGILGGILGISQGSCDLSRYISYFVCGDHLDKRAHSTCIFIDDIQKGPFAD
jgi:hypothetical protein